jgi:Permuted papain-like amidase enzyme, YaeF/YiiX, C92 family
VLDRLRSRAILPVAAVALYGLLLIPDRPPARRANPNRQPFSWNRDARWDELERRFNQARALGCARIALPTDRALHRGQTFVAMMGTRRLTPTAPVYDTIEGNLFELATMVGACRERLADYVRLVSATRAAVKRESWLWDMNVAATRDRLYELLYGSRAALEEVMLQGAQDSVPSLVLGDEETSRTPAAMVLGVTIHSGDFLVSRAGDAVSSLIAVGSDHPGVFSHVAVAYVDPKTSLAYVIESNSDRGVEIHNLEQYLQEVKLRVLVLRLRADLPALVADPMLPHEAATRILANARRRHIPYNFDMSEHGQQRLYCSQLLSSMLDEFHITLWSDMSSISNPGVTAWLAALGVANFQPEEPSDLEYNPQLRIVAEWRDPETLYSDHLDNVVTEALLNGAERGDRLDYSWYLLPAARVVKAYSAVMNLAGGVGPIPEGMSTTIGLRLLRYRWAHAAIKQRVIEGAARFRQRRGYNAPEWELLRFARQAKAELRPRGP